MVMTFDSIEKALGKHCNTAKCVRERVELHREQERFIESTHVKFNPPTVSTQRLPFLQNKR